MVRTADCAPDYRVGNDRPLSCAEVDQHPDGPRIWATIAETIDGHREEIDELEDALSDAQEEVGDLEAAHQQELEEQRQSILDAVMAVLDRSAVEAKVVLLLRKAVEDA